MREHASDRGESRATVRSPEKVSDRIRTGDRLDHNQELYQLSYAHQARRNVAVGMGARDRF